MKAEERDQLLHGLSDIIERLDSLKNQPISTFLRWPTINEWRSAALDFFHKTIDIFKQQCRSFIDGLDTVPRSFGQWTNILDYLWFRLDNLRNYHNRLFCYDYLNVLYHHIFIGEMLECLPSKLSGAKSRFILAPTGELAMRPINKELSTIAADFFDEEYLVRFDALSLEEPVICFDCHQEQNYERQAVLGHEIFHIIVRSNQGLKRLFINLSNKQQVQTLLQSNNQDMLVSQVEEFFCDYIASWYYGPIYLQAFADEITYYPRRTSDTHPPNTLRAKLLLYANNHIKDHKGYSNLRKYLQLHGGTSISMDNRNVFKKMNVEFNRGLAEIGLRKYKYDDISNIVKKSFDVNIPYVAADIRNLINNIPLPSTIKSPENHPALVSESLRKTNLLREIMKHVREPEALFSLPSALS